PATPTVTATATATASIAPSPTPTATATIAPNPTPTATPVSSPTPAVTATASATATATATPTATPTSAPPSQPLNIATRGRIENGDNAMIGGFIVTGTMPKKVIVRAISPSLQASLPDALRDPVLQLRASRSEERRV